MSVSTVQADATQGERDAAICDDLKDIVGADYVLASEPDRIAYNADCWPRGIIRTRGRDVDHHLPSAIVQPADESEVVAVVDWARRHGVALVPYGAGSGVCGGAIAERDQVIIDVKRMRDIVEVSPDDMTVRVQAGVIGWPFERELQRRGFTVGHYPSSIYCSSIGGWVAARGAGQYSSLYGKIEDMTSSVRVVTGRGETLETSAWSGAESSAEVAGQLGPDLTQLFVGSEGTLGVITEATLMMARRPDRQFYRGFKFPDVVTATEAIRELMQTGLRPAVVRLYDALDTLIHKTGSSGESRGAPPTLVERLETIAERNLPGMTSRVREGLREVSNAVVGRVLGQPMAINSLADVVSGECLLVVGFEGHGPLTEDEAEYAFDLLARYGLDLGPEPGQHWLKSRFDVSYKQSPMFATGAFVDTMEVSTTWDNVMNLYDTVREALSPHVVVLAHFSHVYPTGSSIYFTFAGFAPSTEETLELYDQTWKDGLDAVASTGASVAHHHGVGQSKAPWTHHDHPGGREMFQTLKEVFDPDGVLNPGKVYAEVDR